MYCKLGFLISWFILISSCETFLTLDLEIRASLLLDRLARVTVLERYKRRPTDEPALQGNSNYVEVVSAACKELDIDIHFCKW